MNRKSIRWLIAGIVGLIVVAIGAYFWVTNLMSSAQNYRSPLANNPPAPGIALGQSITRKVVVVLIDALRYDTSANATVMPFLNELKMNSATATMHSEPPSFSAPGWDTILSGSWPDINDSQPFNPPDEFSARAFSQDNIFAAAHRSGLQTAISGYSWFKQMLQNSGVTTGFYTPAEDQNADRAVVDAAIPWLTANFQLVLIHLDQVDYAGHHQGGPLNPSWNAAASRVDTLLQEIVSKLDLTQDTILILSDHGQIDRGGHGGPEPVTLVEPFVLSGAGIIPGKYGDENMIDVAPTMAALLGTNIPATNEGHVLINMLELTPQQNVVIQNALKLQQAQLFSAYISSISSTASIGSGEVVSATQIAMDQARIARLAGERVWRNMVAALLIIIPAYILFMRRDKKTLWFAAGAIIYMFLFNLRYGVIDGRTYSLSSVGGTVSLISYTAITASIAVLIAWLIPMLGIKGFSRGSMQAVKGSLWIIWLTIYVLAIPILIGFAINGFIVTWTLPEFYSLFIGLLSIIQLIFVALTGLILTGAASLVGLLVNKAPNI